MNILVIGGGGREHALAAAYAKSKRVKNVYVTPGNGLMDFDSSKINIFPSFGVLDFEKILNLVKSKKVDLVDVAQDDPLAAGLVDVLEVEGIKAFGPSQSAAEIEWNKIWSRNFMEKYKLPTPHFRYFTNPGEAIKYVNAFEEQTFYIKAAGLAQGKGVIRAENKEEAKKAVLAMKQFGRSGKKFLVEQALTGEEFSLFAICDGTNFKILSYAQDHKTVFNGDVGPNTGGMGCVAPTTVLNSAIILNIEQNILNPFMEGMIKEERPYSGVLYLGGMLTKEGIKIIEFNARWGDPEAEVILPAIKTDYLTIVESVLSGKLKKLKINMDDKVRVSVAGCSKGYPGDYSKVKGKRIFGLEMATRQQGITLFGAGIKREGNKFFANGGRVFHLVAEGKDVIETREKAYQAMAQISIEGDNLHYRTDIGWRDVERMRDPERSRRIQKVRVITNIGPDLKGEGILSDIHKMLGIKSVEKVTAVKVYRLEGISQHQIKILADNLLSEAINQSYTINKPIFNGKAQIVEIAYRTGVMNPEVDSILKASKDLGIKLLAADSSYEYAFFGRLTKEAVLKIIEKLKLYNPLIENIVEQEPQTLIIKGEPGKTNIIPIRNLSDNELMDLSKDKLFLNLEEIKQIQKYFQKIKRDPKDVELETIAQTWSEHCAHKTFKARLIVDGKAKEPLFTRIKKEALKHNKNIVSAFVDNAGAMDFYEGWAINGKAETHNAPSAIEPYGGAMTGSGGVFRDVVATGQGAKVVVATDIFCLAPPDLPKDQLPKGTSPPDYMLKRVVAAVRDYGNRVGIPTNNGSFHFHEDFRAKPVVLVGAYGILPKDKAQKGWPKAGDVAVVIGGRTGRDGIHGATFSSGIMNERTITVSAASVQIGNAIEEKRIFDAILESSNNNLIRAVQDLGAGGFSSAIGEMGVKIGVTVNLEKAPLKYQGLAPWEIWVSESQERMLVILSKKNLKKFLKICQKYNAEATEIAEFDGSKKLKVTFGKEIICDLDMQFLHHGLSRRVLKAVKPKSHPEVAKDLTLPKTESGWIKTLENVLSHGDVCSKEPILRMYDHTVQGTSVLPPFAGVGMDGPQDAAIIRPLLDKPYGVVVSHGLNPQLMRVDPYWGSIWAATEAIANFVAVGGDYKNASLINNYIWPFPDEKWLWKLDKCVDAVVDFMRSLKIPVISGKDSLSATYRSSDGLVINIPPTLVMSVFGKLADVTKTTSSDFKKIGSTIVLVGKQDIKVDLKLLPKVLEKIHQAIASGKILACHDVSEGGLITTIFEMCVGGNCGVNIHLAGVQAHLRGDFLFAETAGCFVVELDDDSVAKKLFKGVPYKILGKTQKEEKIVVDKLFSVEVTKLQKAWQAPMKEMFS